MNQRTAAYTHRADVMKTLAILLVILMHSGFSAVPNVYIRCLLGNLAAGGVIVFFVLSGYFFHAKGNFKGFIRKKFVRLCIPWAFGSTLVYVVTHLRTFGILDYVNFLFGNGSYLYYLTMLFLLNLIFFFLHKYRFTLWGAILLTVVSVLLTAFDVIPDAVDKTRLVFTYFENPYLNIFNWMGFFAAGILMQKRRILERLDTSKYGIRIVMLTLSLAVILGLVFCKQFLEYYLMPLSLVNELAVFFLVLSLAWLLPNRLVLRLSVLGTMTFPIYLYHMPLATKLLHSSGLNKNLAVVLIRPLLVLAICYAILFFAKALARKLKLEKGFSLLTGCR